MIRAILTLLIGLMFGFALRGIRNDSYVHSNFSAALSGGETPRDKGASVAAADTADLFSRIASTLRDSNVLAGRADLHRALASLDTSTLQELIRQAEKLPPKYRNELVSSLFERWLELDRPGAEIWLRAAMRDQGCFEAWARIAPDEALKFAVAPTPPRWVRNMSQTALQSLAGNDSCTRFLTLGKLAPSFYRDRLLTEEFKAWAGKEPGTALAWLVNLPKGKLYDSLEREGLVQLASTEPDKATARANELIPDLKATIIGNEFISMLTSALAAKDPLRALEFAQSLPAELREHPLIATTAAWAKNDPLAALEWAQANGVDLAEHYQYGVFSTSTTVLRSAFQSDPSKTVDWIMTLPEGNDRGRWIQYLMEDDFLKGDMNLGQRLFDALPPERQRQSAHDFGWALAENDRLPDLETWTRLFPNESVRDRAFSAAVGQVFDKSPARAEAILAGLSEGRLRDATLAELSSQECAASIPSAMNRALQIRDDIKRRDVMDDMVENWLRHDRETAIDWLKSQENLPRAWVEQWLAD
jgi:hypothetical protein